MNDNRKLISYAIDKLSKSLVHISTVKSGLDCGCVCPSCGGALVAKKGNYRADHFSHYNCSECNGGAETALHLAAKKILLESKELTLPTLSLRDGLFSKLEEEFNHRLDELNLQNFYVGLDSRIISEPIKISVDSVESEKRLYLDDLTYIIPDLILTSHNRQLIIEIVVTNGVDIVKREKLRKINISAMKINLSAIDYSITPDELKSIIIDGSSYKSWIFNKKAHDRFKYYYSNSTQVNYRFKNGDPISKNKCKKDGQINKSCAHCSSQLMYDGKVEWCCYPIKIEETYR
ncbi:hypothetical protein DP73_17705 [Desulfosporosinus sp. HMP52]|uniref:competence protein CoiA family protein n=1 Tax=Desulfosporosinus sp. HMP52 TaxID=1487923 RepID=UPI00051F9682|nr:competence protein CoiA family protein [Desulfosporosinus sp. HMP52]KGK85867.1 hypothetical protein DP73_17705 [Desulfosporosinus sp. HMP52]